MKRFKNSKLCKWMLLTLVLLIMPVFANAKQAPATLQMSGNAPWTKPYLEPGLYYAQNYLSDGRVAYCLEYGVDNPTGLTVAKIKKLDKGYQYLIENGYPNKSITGGGAKDSYITQIAIYWYGDRIAGVPDGKDGMLPAYYKQNPSDPENVKPKIETLLNGAVSARNTSDAKASISASANEKMNFSEDKKYFVSSLVTVNGSSNMKSYAVNITSGAQKAIIYDESGKPRSTFNPGEKFYIRVPVEELDNKELVTVKITGTFVNKVLYSYSAGSSYQTITPPETYEEETTASTTVSFYPSYGKITIIKKDATTKEPLAGAKLVLKDSEGNIVAEWTTTEEAYTINYLPFGEYTLEEVSAPSDYVLSKEIIHITISEDTPEQETIMYNQPYVEVPDTSVKSSTVLTVMGFVILTLGAGTIYATKKKHSK